MVAHIFMEVYLMGYPNRSRAFSQMFSFDTEEELMRFKGKVDALYRRGDVDEELPCF
jgi:hypothetical protein